jgi:hypothetical protein
MCKIWINKVDIMINKGGIWTGKYRIISDQSEPASSGGCFFQVLLKSGALKVAAVPSNLKEKGGWRFWRLQQAIIG